MRQFKALKTFTEQDLKSTYAAGLTYTVRDGNERLEAFANTWAKKGLIEWVPEGATMNGTGHVSWWRRLLSWL